MASIIKWCPVVDRHVRGDSDYGVVWIRLNREDKVIALYLNHTGEKEKFLPLDEKEEQLDWMKLRAETILEGHLAQKIGAGEK
jgi:hypothetical protein